MKSEKYDFTKVLEDIIRFFKTKSRFPGKIYLVRNIYSRFGFYLEGTTSIEFENINALIAKESFSEWIDSFESLEEDDFLKQELEQSSLKITEKIFFSERRLEKTNWFHSRRLVYDNIISFYSFKGGVGRTTALVLVAIELARRGKKIVLIDFDLEAPGLASIFSELKEGQDYTSTVKGVLEFILELSACKNNLEKLDINDYFFSITDQALVGTNGGELIVIPAAITNEDSAADYITKLSKADLKINDYKEFLPDYLIQKVSEEFTPDFIFIDSRTGINDIGGMIHNRYSSKTFCFFFGNKQNMFGLEAILEQIGSPDYPFFLVNSPVPEQETDREEEISYFITESWNIFYKNYNNDDLDVPDLMDESALHYPINVDYSRSAVNLNSYSKISTLLNGVVSDNPYKKMADIILSDKIETITGDNLKNENFSEIVKYLSEIVIDDVGASEEEFKNEEDLIKRFYPRKDYKYIFDPTRFLILGDKGTGKTALFSVLQHENYAAHLADYCGVSITEIENLAWISGYDKGGEFPSKLNFNSLVNFGANQFLTYWLLLLIRTIPPQYISVIDHHHIKKFRTCKLTQLKDFAQKPDTGEIIEEILLDIDSNLKNTHKTLFIVYDYLDLNLSTENNLRGKSIGALLSLWYGYSSRIKNIKAKIFLRNDIFEREVITETDKVKIKNYAVDINWDYDQLLNVIWKRLLSVNPESKTVKSFFSDFEKEINNNYSDRLGTIPFFGEKSNRRILDKLLGKYMGGNNKAFPYNWIIYHVGDTKKKIFPRSIISLFARAAKKQLNDTKENKNPIRPYNMETSMGEVSQNRVADLKEEYPELATVFSELHTVVTQFPADESLFIEGLKQIGEKKPADVIDKLKAIGVLYQYKDKATQKKIRYHIPDLYLFGMSLRRRGPGAHKALYRKK